MKLTPVDEQEHLIRQARFGQELSNLDNMLKQKELQLKKMKSGEEEMDNIRQKYGFFVCPSKYGKNNRLL